MVIFPLAPDRTSHPNNIKAVSLMRVVVVEFNASPNTI